MKGIARTVSIHTAHETTDSLVVRECTPFITKSTSASKEIFITCELTDIHNRLINTRISNKVAS